MNGAIHTHAARIMNIHIDAIGELVSNPSERETRGSRGRIATPLYLKAATSNLGDRHTAKRDKGQLNNRKLMDPSIGKLTYSSSGTRNIVPRMQYTRALQMAD